MNEPLTPLPLARAVVGTDFSAEAEDAFRAAVAIARRSGASLVLAHAAHIPADPPPGIAGSPELAQRWRDAMAQRSAGIDRQFARVRSAVNSNGVAVEYVTVDGHPDSGLVEVATERSADLLVVGAHGRDGGDGGLGSVPARVVCAAPCPVLVTRAPRARSGGFRRALVGIDFSGTGVRALRAALSIVDEHARVDLLHVVNPMALALDLWPSSQQAANGAKDPATKSVLSWVERAGQEIVSRYRGHRELQFDVVDGRPERELRRRLALGSYDLVAIGSHGYRGWRRLVLGSVAESTARRAPCSVLVVHPLHGEGY